MAYSSARYMTEDPRTPEQQQRDAQRMRLTNAAKLQYAEIQRHLKANPSQKMQMQREFNLRPVTKDMEAGDLSALVERMGAARQKYGIGQPPRPQVAPAPPPTRAVSAPAIGVQAAPGSKPSPLDDLGPETAEQMSARTSAGTEAALGAQGAVQDSGGGNLTANEMNDRAGAVQDAAAGKSPGVFAPLDRVRSMEDRMQKAGWNVPTGSLQKYGSGYSVPGKVDPATGEARQISVTPTGTMTMEDFKQRNGLDKLSPTVDPRTRVNGSPGYAADPVFGGMSELGRAIRSRTPTPSGSGRDMMEQTDSAGVTRIVPNDTGVKIGSGNFGQSPVALLPGQAAAEGKGVATPTGREISGKYGSGFATTGGGPRQANAGITDELWFHPAKPVTAPTAATAGVNAIPGSAQKLSDANTPAAPMPSTSAVKTEGTGAQALPAGYAAGQSARKGVRTALDTLEPAAKTVGNAIGSAVSASVNFGRGAADASPFENKMAVTEKLEPGPLWNPPPETVASPITDEARNNWRRSVGLPDAQGGNLPEPSPVANGAVVESDEEKKRRRRAGAYSGLTP